MSLSGIFAHQQLLITHGCTSISLATLEYHRQVVGRLIAVQP